jgi:hypothetical protein
LKRLRLYTLDCGLAEFKDGDAFADILTVVRERSWVR